MSLINISTLEKSFENQKVINLKNFSIEQGKGYVIYGFNGCGKTTFLRLLAGLDKPTCGAINTTISTKDRVMCFQHPFMFTGNVEKNLTYGARLRKSSIEKDILLSYCSRYGIEGILEKSARKLSSGQKQCVALIRAFLVNPKLILLDEPIANLDKNKTEVLNSDLKKHIKHGGSYVIAVHSNQHTLFDYDYCYLLENGTLSPDIQVTKNHEIKPAKMPSELSEEMQHVWQLVGPNIANSELNCKEAFELCKKYEITTVSLACLCNNMKIKIRKCQWGCFK